MTLRMLAKGLRHGLRCIVILSFGLTMTSCSEAPWSLSPTAPSVLKVGYSLERPYTYLNDDGQVVGQSARVLNLVASKLGVEQVQWVLVSFNELLPGLAEGRFDLVGTNLNITPSRQESFLFSSPVAWVCPALLGLRQQYPDGSLESLANTETIIAVLADSIEHESLRTVVDDNQLLPLHDLAQVRVSVEKGVADLLAISAPTANQLTLQWPDIIKVEVDDGKLGGSLAQPVGFVFRKQDQKLKQQWDMALAQLPPKTLHKLQQDFPVFRWPTETSDIARDCS